MEDTEIKIRDLRSNYFRIANEIIDDHGSYIGAYGISVYCVLARHANKEERCWPSLSCIAEEVGVGKASAHRAVELLVERGLISADKTNGKLTVYCLLNTVPLGNGDRSIRERPVLQRNDRFSSGTTVPLQNSNKTNRTRLIEQNSKRDEALPLKEEKQVEATTSDIDMEMGVVPWMKRTLAQKCKELGMKRDWPKKTNERQFETRDCLEFRQEFLDYLEKGNVAGDNFWPSPVDFIVKDGYRGGLAKHVPESRGHGRVKETEDEQYEAYLKAIHD